MTWTAATVTPKRPKNISEAQKAAQDSDAISIVEKWRRDERNSGKQNTADEPLVWRVPRDTVGPNDGEFYSPY